MDVHLAEQLDIVSNHVNTHAPISDATVATHGQTGVTDADGAHSRYRYWLVPPSDNLPDGSRTLTVQGTVPILTPPYRLVPPSRTVFLDNIEVTLDDDEEGDTDEGAGAAADNGIAPEQDAQGPEDAGV